MTHAYRDNIPRTINIKLKYVIEGVSCLCITKGYTKFTEIKNRTRPSELAFANATADKSISVGRLQRIYLINQYRARDPISYTKDFIVLYIRYRKEEEHSRFRTKGLFNYCHISLILSRNQDRRKIFKLSVSGTPGSECLFRSRAL